MEIQAVVEGIRSQGRAHVVTFLGFSDAGYEDEAKVRRIVLDELQNYDPVDTIVCSGATNQGIGLIYPLALEKGFRTAGIVSSVARAEGASFSSECEILFVVDDNTWGGRQSDGSLAATSQAIVSASDVMIGVGGGKIARDELAAALDEGKTVRFYNVEMNHKRAIANAAIAGEPPPRKFDGDAQSLFQKKCGERMP